MIVAKSIIAITGDWIFMYFAQNELYDFNNINGITFE
ncbi:hypothetical protein DFQ11_10340 [Winogradskyella epiphytica]|uniref:Uncharacterized protein n=1 Tax=Winogradskyella epiphytica TaxID=262005 RepID=A0A2V4WVI3_9FLAO|nr:hypothetical protein DFQ11_10340 [Winogradskyella epiphytica]